MTLLPCSKISDDETNSWEVCHHQSSCECKPGSTGTWQGGNYCPTSSHCFSGEERWLRPRVQPRGSDRNLTHHPCSDPSSCPGNSSLARQLAQSWSLHEISTKNRLKTWPRLMATQLDEFWDLHK